MDRKIRRSVVSVHPDSTGTLTYVTLRIKDNRVCSLTPEEAEDIAVMLMYYAKDVRENRLPVMKEGGNNDKATSE